MQKKSWRLTVLNLSNWKWHCYSRKGYIVDLCLHNWSFCSDWISDQATNPQLTNKQILDFKNIAMTLSSWMEKVFLGLSKQNILATHCTSQWLWRWTATEQGPGSLIKLWMSENSLPLLTQGSSSRWSNFCVVMGMGACSGICSPPDQNSFSRVGTPLWSWCGEYPGVLLPTLWRDTLPVRRQVWGTRSWAGTQGSTEDSSPLPARKLEFWPGWWKMIPDQQPAGTLGTWDRWLRFSKWKCTPAGGWKRHLECRRFQNMRSGDWGCWPVFSAWGRTGTTGSWTASNCVAWLTASAALRRCLSSLHKVTSTPTLFGGHWQLS